MYSAMAAIVHFQSRNSEGGAVKEGSVVLFSDVAAAHFRDLGNRSHVVFGEGDLGEVLEEIRKASIFRENDFSKGDLVVELVGEESDEESEVAVMDFGDVERERQGGGVC
jgi:hypothetical protein